MNKSEIDKYGIIIPNGTFTRVKQEYKPTSHINLQWVKGQLHLNVTSKAVPIPNKFNHITVEDVKKHTELVFESTGYYIPFETIMTSRLYWLDMKTDVENTTGYSNKDVFSVLREKAYKNTSKYETPSFDKDKGFENSLLIKSSTKTVNDSLCVYDKVNEIISNRHKYPEYFRNFSNEYLTSHKNWLRFERRLQHSKDIKKAFHLERLKTVTLEDIYNSNIDVVAEKVRKLFM